MNPDEEANDWLDEIIIAQRMDPVYQGPSPVEVERMRPYPNEGSLRNLPQISVNPDELEVERLEWTEADLHYADIMVDELRINRRIAEGLTGAGVTPSVPEPEPEQVNSILYSAADLEYNYLWADMYIYPAPPPLTLEDICDGLSEAATILFQNPDAVSIMEFDDTGDNRRVIVKLPPATIHERTFYHLMLEISRHGSVMVANIFHPFQLFVSGENLHPHIPSGGGQAWFCGDNSSITTLIHTQSYMAALSMTLEIIQSWNPDDQHHSVSGLTMCQYEGCEERIDDDDSYECYRCEHTFCETHAGHWCQGCDSHFCPDCMYDDPDREYCNNCWSELARCHDCSSISDVTACSDCGSDHCYNCMDDECFDCNAATCNNCLHRVSGEYYCYNCASSAREEEARIDLELDEAADWIRDGV